MSNEDKTAKVGAVHHYVPQGYLKRFGTRAKKYQVYVYEVDKEPYKANVHHVAGQRDFYTLIDQKTGEKDALLEDAFAAIDTIGIQALQKLDAMELGFIELSEEDKGNLLAYISFQHTRNLQERKNHVDMYNQMTTKFMQTVAYDKTGWHETAKENPARPYDYEEVERSRQATIDGNLNVKFDPNDQYFMGTTLQMSRTLYEILFNEKRMVLVEASADTSGFITSDNPVTHYLLEEQKKNLRFPFNGVGYMNAVFQFPISPSRCLLLINDDMELETFTYDQDAVDYINYYTYYYADRWIFGNESSKKTKKEFAQCNHGGSHWRMD